MGSRKGSIVSPYEQDNESLGSSKARNFLTSLATISFPIKTMKNRGS
jgi:hypothetical protein